MELEGGGERGLPRAKILGSRLYLSPHKLLKLIGLAHNTCSISVRLPSERAKPGGVFPKLALQILRSLPRTLLHSGEPRAAPETVYSQADQTSPTPCSQ